MSLPRDFVPINLRHVDAKYGRQVIREIAANERLRGVKTDRGRFTWAGPAAETAIVNAYNRAKHQYGADLADVLAYDLWLGSPEGVIRVEVKTRVAEKGWIHPERFDWISVPLHENREPIKADAGLILFAWWAADTPRVLWLVGRLQGLDHFQEVATFYHEGDLLPRGGYVRGKGVYQLDVAELEPVPKGLFREVPNAWPA